MTINQLLDSMQPVDDIDYKIPRINVMWAKTEIVIGHGYHHSRLGKSILDEVISLPDNRDKIADISADITDIIKEYSKVDWTSNTDIHKKISHALDNLLYDYSDNNGWNLSFDTMDKIIDNIKTIALRRF